MLGAQVVLAAGQCRDDQSGQRRRTRADLSTADPVMVAVMPSPPEPVISRATNHVETALVIVVRNAG